MLPLYQSKDQKPGAEIKASAFTFTVVRLLSNELGNIEHDVRDKISTGPRFFANAPVIVDLEHVRDSESDLDFSALARLLKRLTLVPVGVRHATPAQQEAAVDAGLAIVKGGRIRDLPTGPERQAASSDKAGEPQISEPTPSPPKLSCSTESSDSNSTVRAKIVHRPVRSGQQIYAKDGDLIILGAVNAGAEVVSDGNVHIYGPLRGRALAGVQGDCQARIFCQSMAAELVAIAGRYQMLDETVPQEVRGRAVQVYLDGEKLRFELLI